MIKVLFLYAFLFNLNSCYSQNEVSPKTRLLITEYNTETITLGVEQDISPYLLVGFIAINDFQGLEILVI
ncbi:MAG: hypothetical protein ACI865_003309 [Flavobacteriaceae bacterium]|jgi:hypothetical protein